MVSRYPGQGFPTDLITPNPSKWLFLNIGMVSILNKWAVSSPIPAELLMKGFQLVKFLLIFPLYLNSQRV